MHSGTMALFRTSALLACFILAMQPGSAGDRHQANAEAAGQKLKFVQSSSSRPIATFSIVARDAATGDYGIAVQSKYFAVGDVVPFAKADTGALATQAVGNPRHGPAGLKLMGEGVPAEGVIERLLAQDPKAGYRQIGVVDAKGDGESDREREPSSSTGRHFQHYEVAQILSTGHREKDSLCVSRERIGCISTSRQSRKAYNV